MAGALVRMTQSPLARSAARAAAGYIGYSLLDGAIERVNEWIDSREWRKGKLHNGLDLAAPVGTPVLAPCEAWVIGQEENNPEGGRQLFLAGPRMARGSQNDPNRWPRRYAWYARGTPETGRDEIGVDDSGWRFGFAHLSGFNVPDNSVVAKGQQIATTGKDADDKVGHLHLTTSWYQDGLSDLRTYVDPGLLIPGIPRSVPTSPIGPGAAITVCILVRVSTGEQALARCVVQNFPTGIGVNWAATVKGVG